MTEHTPTPWKVEENCLGVYTISAKQGPLTVQPAKAFAEADAAFIIKAVNNHEALVKALRRAIECANAAVAADPNGPEADEAFNMWDEARSNARRVLSAVSSPGESK